MQLLFSLYLSATLFVCHCLKQYYVDAENGVDNAYSPWAGSPGSPFKTLSFALPSSSKDELIIYLKQGQIFSDLQSQVNVSYSLIIKCWTAREKTPPPASCVTISINHSDTSFSVSANLTFDGIRFQKPDNIRAKTLISMTANATVILENAEISNYSFHGPKSLISGGSSSTLKIINTTFRRLKLNSASLIRFTNGVFYMNGVSVKNCVFDGFPAFDLNGSFFFHLGNSNFESNQLRDNNLFTLITESNELIKIDSIAVKNNTGLPSQNNKSVAIFLSFNSHESEYLSPNFTLDANTKNLRMILSNSTFESNSACNGTSGLFVTGRMQIDCSFTNNSVSYSESVINPNGTGVLTIYSSTLIVSNSRFTSNRHAIGGAIFFQGNSRLTISESEFSLNQAILGGSIYIFPSDSRQMSIDMTDSKFVLNAANASTASAGITGYGGAIYCKSMGRLTLSRNNFKLNRAESFGGAFYCIEGLQISSTENNFTNNRAGGYGGGIAIENTNYMAENNNYVGNAANFGGALFIQSGAFSFNNTRFVNNSATRRGGAFLARTVNLSIRDSKFFNCTARIFGGGLYVTTGSTLKISNTDFELSNSRQGSAIYLTGTQGNQTVEGCRFFKNTAEFSLIQISDSALRINSTNFTYTKGSIVVAQADSDVEIYNTLVINSFCSKNTSGCLLDAAFMSSRIIGVAVINMTMTTENSAIFLKAVEKFTLKESHFSNIVGPANGACLSASNSNNISIFNFSVKDFSSGCILLEDSKLINISNFSAENNYGYIKPIAQKSNTNPQDEPALQLNSVSEASISNIAIKGNGRLSKTKGGAIHLSNSRNISLVNGILRDNNAIMGGALFIQNTTVGIKNVAFLTNAAVHGGGIYAERSPAFEQEILNLTNLTFTENHANFTGGGAHFEEMYDFILCNTTFVQNVGLGLVNKSSSSNTNSKGGAIYYTREKKDASGRVDIEGLNVTGNLADVGGAIYFNNHIFDPTKGGTFTNNSATGLKNCSATFASSPVQILPGKEMETDANTAIKIFKNGVSISHDQFIQDYFISNITDSEQWKRFIDPKPNAAPSNIMVEIKYFNQTGGASLQQPLSFYALDYFGQQIEVDNEIYYLGIKSISNNTKNNTYKVNSANGSFVFGEKFISYPGTNITLNIQTNIECLLFNSASILVNIAFKLCDIGEIIPYGSEICSMCPPNSYSLTQAFDSSVRCKDCQRIPGSMCKDGGKYLTIESQYWRSNDTSLNVTRCFNPTACTPKIPDTTSCSNTYPRLEPSNIRDTCSKISYLVQVDVEFSFCSSLVRDEIKSYCAQIFNGTKTGVCNEGYKGDLCATCQDGWGKSKMYECVKCDKTFPFFFQMILAGLIKTGVVFYTVYEAQKANRDRIHSIALRILVTFFQIESMLFDVPLYWPSSFDDVRRFIVSLFRSGVNPGGYSFECIFYWTGTDQNLSYFESNVLYSAFSPLIWTVASGIFILIRKFIFKKPMKWKNSQEILVITCFVTYFYSWPDIITTAAATLHCFDIGAGKLKLYADPAVTCYEARHWIILIFGLTTLILLGFIIPVIFFFKLRKNKKSLDDKDILRKYGFFYRGYTDQYYLWECLVLIRKMAVVSTAVFLARDLPDMCVTLSIIIGISTILQLQFSPFKYEMLNKLELNSLFCLAAIIYGCLYHLNLVGTLSTVIFVGLAAISTIAFLLAWIGAEIGILRTKLGPVCESVKVQAKKCWNSLKRIVKSCIKRICRSQSKYHIDDTDLTIEVNQQLNEWDKSLLADQNFKDTGNIPIVEPLLNEPSANQRKTDNILS